MESTDCPRCARLWADDLLGQAEARHIAMTEGAGAARHFFLERYAEEHAAHDAPRP